MTITFPREDVERFYKSMQRMEKELGMSHKHVLRTGAKKVLSSLGTSTKVSQPYRDYKEIGISRSGKTIAYQIKTKYQTPKRKGKALRRSWQGPMRDQVVYAKNAAELRRRPALIIAMRGVAKESWNQVGKKGQFKIQWNKSMGNDVRTQKMQRATAKAARRWVEYRQVFGKAEQYIRITNSIRHIESALVGGKNTVNTVMERAASGMEKQIENRLKSEAKKLQAAKL